MRSPEGIWPVLITPLKDGEVDVRSLENLIKWLEEFPIGGFWALGTGSEDHHLTFEQRVVAANVVAEIATKPVVMGCSFYSLRETREFLREAPYAEYEAYHWTPYHRLMSVSQILRQFQELAEWERVWAYTSANWSTHVPPVEWTGKGAMGLKFSSQRTSHLQEALALDSEDFPVMTAVATQTRICRLLGSKRHTSSIASALPELSCAAWESSEGQDRLSKVLKSFTAKRDNFVSAAEEKHILVKRGIIDSAEVTEGYRGLTPDEADQLDATVAAALN